MFVVGPHLTGLQAPDSYDCWGESSVEVQLARGQIDLKQN